MATTATLTTLDGLFKQVYGDDITNLIPENLHVIRNVSFDKKDGPGLAFNQPVIVQQEAGVTYAAAGAGAYALNSAISMQMANAQVTVPQITLRASIATDAIAQSFSEGKTAFKSATKLQMENVMESISKRVEIACLYGQSGIGIADDSTNVDATNTDVLFVAGSFASGIWSGAEGQQVQFFKVSDGSLVSSAADSVFTVGIIDPTPAAPVIRFSGTATGISALDTALNAGNCDIYFNSARVSASVWNEMPGMDKIITNTGVLFNINASTYALWKGNSYAVGGALTFAKLQNGIALAAARGGLDEDVTIYVNPGSWSDLLTDQAALRQYDTSYTAARAVNGMTKITFNSQNGKMDIVAHPYVKPSDAFAVPLKRFKRIGSLDFSFKIPGTGDQVFWQMPDNNGYQFRCYTAQQLFCETPAKTVKFTGVTHT